MSNKKVKKQIKKETRGRPKVFKGEVYVFTLRLPKDLHTQLLKKVARSESNSLNTYILKKLQTN